uniref:2-aminoethanethiol dioxygenase n=1 Tax=Caligus clemensi TaxID=344056 RepID=C1C0E2_CALCM|nr:2-aminoethanethiol dioxygenase [Caligus clemensi]
MSSCIQKIVQLAKVAATHKAPFELDEHLLKALNSLTIHELYFDPREPFESHNGLPAYYVDIHEDQHLSIGIFFLNGSTKIPLHDHPHMTGIIKCIAGNLNIVSFSPLQELNDDNDPSSTIIALPHETLTLSSSSEPKMLTPNSRNIHEVQNTSKSSLAAFLDILTPPYNIPDQSEFSPNEGVRPCNYYEIVKKETDSVSLRIVEKPDEFICRSYKFFSY